MEGRVRRSGNVGRWANSRSDWTVSYRTRSEPPRLALPSHQSSRHTTCRALSGVIPLQATFERDRRLFQNSHSMRFPSNTPDTSWRTAGGWICAWSIEDSSVHLSTWVQHHSSTYTSCSGVFMSLRLNPGQCTRPRRCPRDLACPTSPLSGRNKKNRIHRLYIEGGLPLSVVKRLMANQTPPFPATCVASRPQILFRTSMLTSCTSENQYKRFRKWGWGKYSKSTKPVSLRSRQQAEMPAAGPSANQIPRLSISIPRLSRKGTIVEISS